MKKYKLRYLPLFYQDLSEILNYIRFQLKNPVAAERLLDAVESAIVERANSAEAFQPYPSHRDRAHPYYRIPVKNFVILYVVIDDVMEVRRIVYARRDIGRLI